MSVLTSARVWANSQHSGSHLLMLLAIADFSDDDGRAYPSVTTLAKKCRMSDRNARFILADLRQSAELIVRFGEGPKGANQYVIPLKPFSHLKEPSVLKTLSSTPEKLGRNPLKPVSAKPSVNHQETIEGKKRTRSSCKVTFETWLNEMKSSGQRAYSDYLAVWDYATRVGLTDEWIDIAWSKFRSRYLNDPAYQDKKYSDWRRVFLNAVEGNWLRLWYFDEKANAFALTTTGHQAEIETRRKA